MIKKIHRQLQKRISVIDDHTKEVIKKSFSSSLVKVSGLLFSVGVSIFLGRTIGAEGLGIINLCAKITNIMVVVGLLGMRQLIIKEIAIAYNNKNFSHIGDVMYSSYWFNGTISIAISVIFILLSPWLSTNIFRDIKITVPLIIALTAMTPQIFSRIFSSALVGYKKIWQSNLVDNTLSLVFVAILLGFHLLFKKEITINRVAIYFAFGRILVTIIIGYYWNTLYKVKKASKLIIKKLLKTSVPLFYASFSTIIIANSDVILIGIFENAEDVGFYTVASRLALLTSLFLQITNTSIAPKIAALFENKNITMLEKMVQNVTRGLGLIGIVQLVVFIFGGKLLLSLWGDEFSNSYWILVILSIGQLINIGTGAVGQILIMCGYEKVQRNTSIVYLFVNILLNILFIILWGTIGAAIATAFTYAGINLTRYYYIYKLIKIKVLI